MTKEKSCGCVIIDEGRILLVFEKLAQYWGFPKGHVENNETEVETARREVLEEVGLEVEINEKARYEIHYHTELEKDKTCVFFVAAPKSLNIQKQDSEIEKAEWFEFEKGIEALTYNSQKEILRSIVKKLPKDNL